MKCDIIKDLLPSYVDNLCSSESQDAIQEHLLQCPSCQKYLEEMQTDFSFSPTINEEIVENNLSEKDLLARSKDTIQLTQAKKILKIIHISCIFFSVLFLLVGTLFLCFAYLPKYPHTDLSGGYMLTLMLILLPIILGVFELCTLQKMKHYVFHIISSILIQCVLLFLAFVSAICFFIILPPISSTTTDTADYLIMDSSVEEFRPVYEVFFPASIPAQATDIQYFYSCKKAIFSEDVAISASWILPADEYVAAKEQLLENHYIEKDGNSWSVVLKGVRYPDKVDLNFIYDDNLQMVTYILTYNKNI